MKVKKALCTALLSAALFTPSTANAVIPGISPDKYIRTYILGEENIPVYTDSSLKDLGYNYLNYHSNMENSMLNKILTELAYGKPVLLCCEGAEDFHWIVVTGYDGIPTGKLSPESFSVNDPWNPACKDLGDFLARHKVVHQMIF